MSLRNYIPPSQEILIPGNESFVVRGLSLTDIATIVRNFRPEIDKVWKNIEGVIAGRGVADLDIGAMMTIAFETAPLLVTSIVAMAAEEPDMAEAINRLPIGVQVEAVQAVGNLTFDGAGGSKNVVEAVTRMLVGVRGLATPRQLQS